MNTIVRATKEVNIDTLPRRRRNAKPVYNITTGEIYASVTDAAIALHAYSDHVSRVCLGDSHNFTVKGNQLCYLSDLPKRVLDICNKMTENRRAVENLARENAAHADRINDLRALELKISNAQALFTQIAAEIAVVQQRLA